jgi:RNA polymerase sigma factor (sigma-70 family)
MEISDLFGTEDFDSIDRKIEFERMLEELSARDKRIVYLYASGHTQEEIGAIVGLTQRRIGQILQEISKRHEQWH